LSAIPFISNGQPLEVIRNCVMLLMLNGVYALRAYTEERHLSRDPIYRQYQQAMARQGLVARMRRLLQFA